MKKQDPIQAQLIAARRSQILEAATKVFAEKGFHRATIKDVAKAADIADGTIYNYFENKTALLLGLLDRLNETPHREEHFSQASKMKLGDWVRGYIHERYETLGTQGFDIFQIMLSEILVNPELRELYSQQVIQPTYALAKRYFQKWMKEGSVKEIDPALTMRAISGMFLGVVMLRLMGDPELKTRWDEMPDVMAEIILNGLTEDSDG
jgi:AcrR family transcriptional regulator